MSGQWSRAWVEVDLTAIVENARTAARVAGTRLLPVVKANAYGLGAAAVCTALESLDPWGYGVATVDEGAALRAAGVTRPVLVLMPVFPTLFGECERFGLTPTLADPHAITQWTARGSRPFHVEIDTGMSRTGVRWDEIDQLCAALDTPSFEGCYTQFHSADRTDGSLERQAERFLEAVGRLPRRPAVLHAANSAAALRGPRYAYDLIRPGVFLYGGAAAPGLPAPAPVVSLRARVVAVRRLAAGDSVSYGARWTAAAPTRLATLAIGYADGVRRSLGREQGRVLLGGGLCPVVGVVTMDFTTVDVGDRAVQVGDVATLIGESDGGRITLEEYARAWDLLQHDALTSLGPRLPRIYD